MFGANSRRNWVQDLLENPEINAGSPAWDALRRFVSNRLQTVLAEEAYRLVVAAGNFGTRSPLLTILDEINREHQEAERQRIFNLRNGVFHHQTPRRPEAFSNMNRGNFHNNVLVLDKPKKKFID